MTFWEKYIAKIKKDKVLDEIKQFTELFFALGPVASCSHTIGKLCFIDISGYF